MSFQSALGRKLQRLGTLPGPRPQTAPAPEPLGARQTVDGEEALLADQGAALAPGSGVEHVLEPASLRATRGGATFGARAGQGAPGMLRGDAAHGGVPEVLGIPEPTAHGVLHATRRQYGPEHRHGRVPVRSALAARSEHVAALALDPALAEVPLDRALLLDTETTGLAGGAGTLPFLVGLGWFEPDGGLTLEQLFLRRPGEERPMLARLSERLAAASCVVSFNGKSYDWPLLRTRFVMNRMPVPAPPPHLDLLHCARRAFKYRCESARLTELEEAVVGHVRHGDVPGHLIPELYFAYLRGRGHGPLKRVMEHNAQDLVMLAALLGHLAERFAAPDPAADPRDALGLAEVAFRAHDHARADAFAARAATSPRPDLGSAAMVIRARVCWRARDIPGAVTWLEQAVKLAVGPFAARLHLALAKLHEHRTRDLPRAMHHASHAYGAEPPHRSTRRAERLEKKLASLTSISK